MLSGIVAGMSSELFGPIAEVCGSLAVVAPAAPHDERAPNQLDALLRTHSGVLVCAQAGWSPQPVPFAGITIYGDAGALVWEWAPPFRVQLCRAGAQSWEERPPTIPADLGAAWTPTREFVAAVRAGASGALDFGRGLHELCVAEALERSSASGRFESVDAS